MKRATSRCSTSLSRESERAALSTWLEAEPVSAAPALTLAMLLATSAVPCAASWTLREISWVAAPCC